MNPDPAADLPQPEPGETSSPAEAPPLRWAELVAVGLLVVLSDLTIYRGRGFGGYALLFVGGAVLLLLGYFRPRIGPATWLIGAMLGALAAKMLWCGSGLLVASGFALLVAFAMTLAGHCPYVFATAVFASQILRAGCDGLIQYGRRVSDLARPRLGTRWFNVALPCVAFVVYSLIFIVANPDVLGFVSERLEIYFIRLREWLLYISFGEILFWLAALWVSVGLLRPLASRPPIDLDPAPSGARAAAGEPSQSLVYTAFRNTLVTVIVLFAGYLVFEFQTLWFREFPQGFHYSGYAHEGAAWLTVALGLATAILSLVFSGRVLQDPRLPRLRSLAWIWSVQNFLLALAVYNRLFIYIGFNGMTRMRTVGLFGITTVVVGFVFVLWKISRSRSFVWLLRRHLWTLALAIYLFALTPVDYFVVRHNVHRILAGDPKPSVQIVAHPINAEGILSLRPLVESRDPTIREGVRALLARFDDEAEADAKRRKAADWTAYQISDEVVLRGLRASRGAWAEYTDRSKAGRAKRGAAYKAFAKYAYQWY